MTPPASLRRSPFYESTLADGVCAFTTYNHMLLPTSFGHAEAEYWRIINGVSRWDVACERQVQLKGPDDGILNQRSDCAETRRSRFETMSRRCYPNW